MLVRHYQGAALLRDKLTELVELERILQLAGDRAEVRVVQEVECWGNRLPVYAITLGNPSPDVPAIGFFGGVHGLERIGAEVVLAFLNSLLIRLGWDHTLHHQLESLRLVFMPLVNPGGLLQGTRANPNGVDLMRNAPVDAVERVPSWVGGQRVSPRLPWYRGRLGEPMEAESQALCSVVDQELLSRKFSISVDCHSGFGLSDRLWFPFAHTRQPFHHLAEMHALNEIFQTTHSHNQYIFEPQSLQYLTHGDLWDYLYLRSRQNPDRIFLPLTLEMGSWLWIKKNPRQLFSRHGFFNPLIEHRQQRVLRRHMGLLDFMARAACSAPSWLPIDEPQRRQQHVQALQQWY
ncbi:M14 family zinc carboxypeptidase [Rhodoferax aquaticus]|uniref:Zinc carboxypeptidase n=1 Tax=Rhodoferax aquaticus TaxID=2527691 RepID=A0A515EMM5_9BURK|nr:M14 family zinc carboxypeptidase [Rhodoferax aquaticus]QDL53894.1 zinc carboxypeptidase [Rhodoferax aquaticus]